MNEFLSAHLCEGSMPDQGADVDGAVDLIENQSDVKVLSEFTARPAGFEDFRSLLASWFDRQNWTMPSLLQYQPRSAFVSSLGLSS
jgi:hypothetical protein